MADFLFLGKKDFGNLLNLALAATQNQHKVKIFLNDPKTKALENVSSLLNQLIKKQIPIYYYSNKAELPEIYNNLIPRRIDELGELLENCDHLIAL